MPLTDTTEGKALLNEVAYRLISEQAPDELPLYVAARDSFFADPVAFSRPPRGADHPMAAVGPDWAQTVTVVALPVLAAVLPIILARAGAALQAQSERLLDWAKELLASKAPSSPPVLDQVALDEVDRVIGEVITDILPPSARSKGEAVRNAVMRKLALARRRSGPAGS